jgi:hypothetical protein
MWKRGVWQWNFSINPSTNVVDTLMLKAEDEEKEEEDE